MRIIKLAISASLTLANEGVIEGGDEIGLELVAVGRGRHRVGASVHARSLERWR